MRVGVLALQGAVEAHQTALNKADPLVETIAVKNAEQLDVCDGLIIPGGESTVISKLARSARLVDSLTEFCNHKPVWGTCAGMILLANAIDDGDPDLLTFASVPVRVRRNAYGRQLNSFESDIQISGVGEFHAIFIRAPAVMSVGDGVSVIGRDNVNPELAESLNPEYKDAGIPVAIEYQNVLATSFHPELTSDERMHEYFLRKVFG